MRKSIAILLLLAASALSEKLCNKICDNSTTTRVRSPQLASNITKSSRVIELYISDEDNVAYASIKKGSSKDSVWLDRSFNGGISLSEAGLGNTTLSKGQDTANTTAFNVDGIIEKQEVGLVRACGKLGSKVACTEWMRSKVLASNPLEAAATAMMQLYKSEGMWETAEWDESPNCLISMMNYWSVANESKTFRYIMNNTYEKQKSSYKGQFRSESLSSSATWGLAWAQAYQITGDKKYLDTAQLICDYIKQYKTRKCEGGFAATTDGHHPDAFTTESFMKLAAKLHNNTPGDKKYLKWAENTWKWFLTSGLINAGNLINDELGHNCKNEGYTVSTRNQGVILGAAAELFNATKDKQYLEVARKIANAVVASLKLNNPDNVLQEECEIDGDCGSKSVDSSKGIFVRNLGELELVLPDKPYEDYLRTNAKSISARNQNSLNQYGFHFNGPFANFSAATQHSALDMLVASMRQPK